MAERIAEAARELDRLRTGWLNPPEWTREKVLEFPGSASGPWARSSRHRACLGGSTAFALLTFSFRRIRSSAEAAKPLRQAQGREDHTLHVPAPLSRGIGTIRYPRRVPNSDKAAGELAKDTLTNLYNQRPT